jgi:hypothetical protein
MGWEGALSVCFSARARAALLIKCAYTRLGALGLWTFWDMGAVLYDYLCVAMRCSGQMPLSWFICIHLYPSSFLILILILTCSCVVSAPVRSGFHVANLKNRAYPEFVHLTILLQLQAAPCPAYIIPIEHYLCLSSESVDQWATRVHNFRTNSEVAT